MSDASIKATLIELIIAGLLIYGFMNEEKIIAFEQGIKRIVLGNYRRSKRILKPKVMRLYRNIKRIVIGNYRRIKRMKINRKVVITE